MKILNCAAIAASALLLVSGCGGGFSASGPVAQSIKLGQASIAYSGGNNVKPFVQQGSGSVTVTGMSGASYTSVGLVPSQSLSNSAVVFTDKAGMWTVTPGLPATEISGSTGGIYTLGGSFTNDGHILFLGFDNKLKNFFPYECNYDGSNITKLFSTSITPDEGLAWAPNNSKVAWVDNASGNLKVSNTNGTSAVTIGSGLLFPAFSPDSSTLAFQKQNNGYSQIYTCPASGGTPTLYPGQSPTANFYGPQWESDGGAIFMTFDSGTARSLYLDASGVSVTSIDPPSGFEDIEQVTFAPDNKTIAYLQTPTYTETDFTVQMSDIYGKGASTLYTGPITYRGYPNWSPFFGSKNFVGSGGALFSSAAGFLWGQNGSAFASMVAFTASNPSSATVTPETSGATGGELIFDIHATSLTGLKYMNCYYGAVTSVVSGSSLTDALISFNSTTGQVDTIAPFIAERGSVNPVQQGGDLVFQAKFPGVWNGKGQNIAPSGASSITINASTGKMAQVNP